MSKHLPKNESFFMLTPNVRDKLLEAKLTAAEWRIWCYLVSLDPFGDSGTKFSPSELMFKCSVKKSTYFAAKAKFQQLGLFDFRDGTTKVFNLQSCFNHSKNLDYSQQQELVESKILESNSKISDLDSEVSELDSKISEFVASEPLPNQDSSSLQTLKTLKTNQTRVAGEKNEEEENAPTDIITEPVQPVPPTNAPSTTTLVENQNRESSTKDINTSGSITHISKILTSTPNPRERKNPAPINKNSQIPQELKNKLEELEIPLDSRVKKAIASHDISQAYGAVAHIERTWETISNPRGVFLFQISKQPIEPLGPRLPVKTASDWGYTLEDIKKMYPYNWKDAAVHFGVEVE